MVDRCLVLPGLDEAPARPAMPTRVAGSYRAIAVASAGRGESEVDPVFHGGLRAALDVPRAPA
jgi:hypothetical protein